jgi:hypothetical protein
MSSVLRRTSQRLTPRYSLPRGEYCYAYTQDQLLASLLIEGQSCYGGDCSSQRSMIIFDTLAHLIAAVSAIEVNTYKVQPTGPYLFTDLGHSITVGVAGGQNYLTYRSVLFSNGPYSNATPTAYDTHIPYYVISDSTLDLSVSSSGSNGFGACHIVRAD